VAPRTGPLSTRLVRDTGSAELAPRQIVLPVDGERLTP
jgi:hypothetical protein